MRWGFLLAPKTPVPRVRAYVRVRCEQAVSGGHEIVQPSLKVGLAEAETMGRRVRWGWGASSSPTVTGVAAPFIVGFVVVISAQEALQRATAS